MESNNGTGFGQLKCHVFKDYNAVFDEKGSSCGVIRKVQWIKGDGEPDESKAKLEIRKIYTSADGEKNGKAYTFGTEEGPHELVTSMIDCGFGHTKDIIEHIKDRDDFISAVNSISDEDANVSDADGEVFDMRDLLLNDIGDDIEDETA